MITNSKTFCPAPWTSLNIDQTGRVVEKYNHKHNLAIDTLQRYRMTLVDNSYLPVQQYKLQTVKFHRAKEHELKKTMTFVQLWPELTQKL